MVLIHGFLLYITEPKHFVKAGLLFSPANVASIAVVPQTGLGA